MFHQLTFTGHLGQDPVLRQLPSGTPVVNFSVAANRYWTNSDGEKQEETVWFRVASYGAAAENHAKYLSKGRQVQVVGRLRPDPETGGPRVWTGNDGKARASFEVTTDRVIYLGNGNGGSKPASTEEEGESIPF